MTRSDNQRADSAKADTANAAIKVEDAFWLTDIYPDAAALFSHDIVPLQDIAEECIVVLDANILLWPYEYSSESLDAVEKVYQALSTAERLIVPAQAAREFYKHRSQKISSISQKIEGAASKQNLQVFDEIAILQNDNEYQEARDIAKEMANLGRQVAAKLRGINQKLKEDIGSDRVSSIYRNILSSRVVEIPLSSDDRKALLDDMKRRSKHRIAPGFQDGGKADGGIGDLIIWKTLLQEANKRKCHAIFVTDEAKNDWWIRSSGAFHPRPELLEEFRQYSGGKSLHMIPLSGLLSLYDSPEEVVQQAQRLEEQAKSFSNRVLLNLAKARSNNVLAGHRARLSDELVQTRAAIAKLQTSRVEIVEDERLPEKDRATLLDLINASIDEEMKKAQRLQNQIASTEPDRSWTHHLSPPFAPGSPVTPSVLEKLMGIGIAAVEQADGDEAER